MLLVKTAMLKILDAALFVFVCLAAHSSEADVAYDKAMASLRDAESDHAKLVPAIRLLGEAQSLFEKGGDAERATTINSCLYWAKKKLTLADTEILKPMAEVVKRLETASAPAPVSQAKAMLERADKFAKSHATDHMSIAVQYFEIADRFPESDDGRKALKLSLGAMQNVKTKAPTNASIDIDFESGWDVFVDGRDAGVKTPGTAELPLGKHVVVLAKDGFVDISIPIQVNGYEKIEPKQKPQQGKSAVLTFLAEKKKELSKEIVGIWHGKASQWADKIEFKEDGSFKRMSWDDSGKWKYDGKVLSLMWDKWPQSDLLRIDKNTFSIDRFILRR